MMTQNADRQNTVTPRVCQGSGDLLEPGRRTDGTFAPGNKFGLGNQGGRRTMTAHMNRFLDVLVEQVTDGDLLAITRKVIDQAKKGQPEARRFLYEYVVGKPTQRQEVASSDLADLLRRWQDDLPHDGG